MLVKENPDKKITKTTILRENNHYIDDIKVTINYNIKRKEPRQEPCGTIALIRHPPEDFPSITIQSTVFYQEME